MLEALGVVIGFIALWITNWLVVMTMIQPIALKFGAPKNGTKPEYVPGEASSAPVRHYFKAKSVIALAISLGATIWLWHLGSSGYFGRDFWYNNWLARQVSF